MSWIIAIAFGWLAAFFAMMATNNYLIYLAVFSGFFSVAFLVKYLAHSEREDKKEKIIEYKNW